GADYILVGPGGERVVPAARFYHNDGINYLTKQPDEILSAVRLPRPDGWDAVYHKLRRRDAFDFPVLGVAVWLKWERGKGKGERGTVAEARIVLGGVASWPQEVPEAGGGGGGATGGAGGGGGPRPNGFVRGGDRGRRRRRVSARQAHGQHRFR